MSDHARGSSPRLSLLMLLLVSAVAFVTGIFASHTAGAQSNSADVYRPSGAKKGQDCPPNLQKKNGDCLVTVRPLDSLTAKEWEEINRKLSTPTEELERRRRDEIALQRRCNEAEALTLDAAKACLPTWQGKNRYYRASSDGSRPDLQLQPDVIRLAKIADWCAEVTPSLTSARSVDEIAFCGEANFNPRNVARLNPDCEEKRRASASSPTPHTQLSWRYFPDTRAATNYYTSMYLPSMPPEVSQQFDIICIFGNNGEWFRDPLNPDHCQLLTPTPNKSVATTVRMFAETIPKAEPLQPDQCSLRGRVFRFGVQLEYPAK